MNGQVAQWSTMQVIPKSSTMFTIHTLTPDTTYEFKVLARNDLGSGNFSETVRASTKGQSSSVSHLLVFFRGCPEIVFQWVRFEITPDKFIWKCR